MNKAIQFPAAPVEKTDKELDNILTYLSALSIVGKKCLDDPETRQRFVDQLPGYLRSAEIQASRLRPLKLQAFK